MKIKNPLGLSFDFLENGLVRNIEIDPIRVNLKPGTPFSDSGTNLFLRKRGKSIQYRPLLGPGSQNLFQLQDDAFIAKGIWEGLDYACMLQLSLKSLSWQWSIDIRNNCGETAELDIIYVQDVGLKPISAGLVNEYYVSQYLERLILHDNTYGPVVCCRQNTKEPVGNPWIMLACKNKAISASTDGMQFLGKTFRETGIPEALKAESLGGEYSGELSIIALQESPFTLAPGGSHKSIFVASYLPDHPAATSADDLVQLSALMLEFQDNIAVGNPENFSSPDRTIFNSSDFLPVTDLTEEELNLFFDPQKRHSEVVERKLLSFFHNHSNHVMLRAKEMLTDRPHGHIMQAEAGYRADENIVSTTAYAFGVFNSHITQGNTNFNIFLSVCTSQFNDLRQTGQRIFVEIEGRLFLLGVPSAFEMGLNHCRWIYKSGDHIFQVRTWTSKSAPRINMDFKVISGGNVRLLVTHDFDKLNGWKVTPGINPGEYVASPEPGSMISGKFPKAQFRIVVNSESENYQAYGDEIVFPGSTVHHNKNLFVLGVQQTSNFSISFIGEVISKADVSRIDNTDNQWLSDCRDAQLQWQDLSLNLALGGDQPNIAAIREILPWFAMNAMTHFLTPYGLEQFSGAAWGTRDVSQGPVDLLLTMGKYDDARQVLRIIFSNQNPDGGWPQWWMFDSYSSIRAGDSHGDVFYWVIIALSNYIKVTGELEILNEVLPFFTGDSGVITERKPISEHIDRLIQMIINSFIPGTSLVPFGGGDWNDSLQPVNSELAERMISSWTVEMNFQAFNEYKNVYSQTGKEEKAQELDEICTRIKSDFNKYLVKDGVVAGYGLVEKDGSISVLLHPSDTTTGIHYSLLPMDRGVISGIFTKEQALHHQLLINKYLKGPDGARLMDRPLQYKGGIQEIFQRAESSTFFGREIGLMYVHEHIRYAESQAILGNADEFVKSLRQANPIGYRGIVPCGDIRQANCYYSSSDVAFKSRYDADQRYDEIKTGEITLRGGWRVYSSGPGIYITLVITRLLGLRQEHGKIIIDPVIPKSMVGFSASMDFMGHNVTFNYSMNEGTYCPKSISVNGNLIEFGYEENNYRRGGAVIEADRFQSLMNRKENIVDIIL